MDNAAKQISFLRSSLKLTQVEFAKNIGYSRSYVKDIESNRVKPSRGFLEAVSKTYGVSVDSLINSFGALILNVINRIPDCSGEGFVYLYDFTDVGLEEAENKLLEYLDNRSFVVIDGRKIDTETEFYAALLRKETTLGTSDAMSMRLREEYSDMQDYLFVILKNFSSSPVRKRRNPALYYREVWRALGRRGSLIVIDKPSFLERNANQLYYYAYPIHFSERGGRMHPPTK